MKMGGAGPLRVALLTVSDACARGERKDQSGDAVAAWCEEVGNQLVERAVVPDETHRITPLLLAWAGAAAFAGRRFAAMTEAPGPDPASRRPDVSPPTELDSA